MSDSNWHAPFLEELDIPGGTYGSVDDSEGDEGGNQDEGTLS